MPLSLKWIIKMNENGTFSFQQLVASILWSRQRPEQQQMNGETIIFWLVHILSKIWRLRWKSVNLQMTLLEEQWT